MNISIYIVASLLKITVKILLGNSERCVATVHSFICLLFRDNLKVVLRQLDFDVEVHNDLPCRVSKQHSLAKLLYWYQFITIGGNSICKHDSSNQHDTIFSENIKAIFSRKCNCRLYRLYLVTKSLNLISILILILQLQRGLVFIVIVSLISIKKNFLIQEIERILEQASMEDHSDADCILVTGIWSIS